ncbi:hypothetical protein V6N11_049874 [Hibiscus sabdariffa]|uniref:Uncharacterized protein n=1 Tax=Hibiscus sabdariffa TaxID=183260 RepID=A0ABR2T853_9ROSI
MNPERVNGFVLYGSRVGILFAARETRESFWSRKKRSLPRLPDPPPIGVDGSINAVRAEDVHMAISFRSVEGIVDSEKLSVL